MHWRPLGLEEAAGWIGVAGDMAYPDSPQSTGLDCATAPEFKFEKTCFVERRLGAPRVEQSRPRGIMMVMFSHFS